MLMAIPVEDLNTCTWSKICRKLGPNIGERFLWELDDIMDRFE